jgi:hypothetical protein
LSTREPAYQALLAALETGLQPWPVSRNGTAPVELTEPAAILRDGEAEADGEPTLGVRAWPWADPAQVELYAQSDVPGALEAMAQELVDRLEAALADRTLGGVVDWLEVGPPRMAIEGELGVVPFMAAAVTVTMFYTSAAASG